MSKHRSNLSASQENLSQSKKPRTEDLSKNSLHKCLEECGLTLKHPPGRCVATQETVHIIRQIKRYIDHQFNYPRNIPELLSNLTNECEDINVFKHYLYPNIVRHQDENSDEYVLSDSVIRILLSVPSLHNKLIDYIFDKAMDLAVEGKCAPWIQIILKCLSTLDVLVDTEKISSKLVDLMDVTTEKMVRLEIIISIPDIVGDQEYQNIASEMSRFLTEDHELTPAILDCLSYLCLSDDQYEMLQKKTLNILMTLPKCTYFSNFVKFLLMPGRLSDAGYLEAVQGVRNALGWPTTLATANEIATSQVLTALAIRTSIVSSKAIGNAWMKTVASCKVNTDHKPIDIVILLILYSTTEERQRQVENLIKKQLKLNILKEDFLNDAFEKYKPIFKEYLRNLIELCNSLFKNKGDPMVEMFTSHLYTLMYSELDDCRPTVIAELLQLGLDRKQCIMNILSILNNVAAKDMSLLKPQSLQMLTLLDRMDGMTLTEIRSVMNLVCGLAYSFENSIIRDDIHMILRKELGSSSPTIKIQGILAGVFAVKYIVANASDNDTIEMPDDVSYSSFAFLPEGPLRDAAQIIELISRSTRQYPDMIAFFYDELSDIINNTTNMNKQFLSWLTDAVTNDLQQNFIIDNMENDRIGELKMSMQYCLNADSEMDEVIAINIAPLTLASKDGVDVGIISPLFQLVQSLHYKLHEGDLTSIDALLGCPVVMPKFDVDLIEDMESNSISQTLDCMVHCTNWFRELLNAFATQTDEALRSKLLQRIIHIQEIDTAIEQVLLKTSLAYKPPVCKFDIKKYTEGQTDRKPLKPPPKSKAQKKPQPNDSVLPETAKSQPTQNAPLKNKIEIIQNIPLRSPSLKLLKLFDNELSVEHDSDSELNIKSLRFLLKAANRNMEQLLISKIKRNTFLTTKQEEVYNPKKAEACANNFNEILPKMLDHLKTITSYLETCDLFKTLDETDAMYTAENMAYIEGLESIYKILTIYFKWIGFKNHQHALLKSSLRTIACHSDQSNANVMSLKELLLIVAKYLQNHEKFCLQLSTATALIELTTAIQEHSDSVTVLKILREMAKKFLSKQWRTPDGALEKGLMFNQTVDKLVSTYLLNNEIVTLKTILLQLTSDITALKNNKDSLESIQCINKANFPILYRNLGTAILEAAKARLNKGLTNPEHLTLWKEIATLLKYMSDIAKSLDNRNNLSAFFKKSLPIIKLFLSQGMPIIEMQFKSYTQEVLEIFKILQQSTRFLQSLCCHSRLKKDSALMSKVPFVRELLETLIYKVKAALAANKCSEAFWMGNLKNKDIHGEVIQTQHSVESEESVEDCDEQLPEDDSDESDDEILNPDSKSISDII